MVIDLTLNDDPITFQSSLVPTTTTTTTDNKSIQNDHLEPNDNDNSYQQQHLDRLNLLISSSSTSSIKIAAYFCSTIYKQQQQQQISFINEIDSIPNFQRIFYINHQTKTTSWLPPNNIWNQICYDPTLATLQQQQLSESSSITSSSTTSTSTDPSTELQQHQQQQQRVFIHSNHNHPIDNSIQSPTTSTSILPFGWEIAIDAEGRQYYINHINCSTTYQLPINKEFDDDPPPQPRIVQLKRDKQLGFGFVAGSDRPVIVRFVKENGPSENKLQSGDQIFEVNGHNVRNSPREHVIELIKSSEETVTLVVCQPYTQNSIRKSALLTAAKKQRLRSNPSRVRFAEGVIVNGSPLFHSCSSSSSSSTTTTTMAPTYKSTSCTCGTSSSSSSSLSSSEMFTGTNVLKIFLENGQTKTFKYDGNTTVQNVVDSLCEKLAIKSYQHYGLMCEQMFNNQNNVHHQHHTKQQPEQQLQSPSAAAASSVSLSSPPPLPSTPTSSQQQQPFLSSSGFAANIASSTSSNPNNVDNSGHYHHHNHQTNSHQHHHHHHHHSINYRNNNNNNNNKLTLLDPNEMIANIAARPNAHNLRCLFRIIIVPIDPAKLLEQDRQTFEYFYQQCCNDIINERFVPEIKYEMAIRLASIHIIEHVLSQQQQQQQQSTKQMENQSKTFSTTTVKTETKTTTTIQAKNLNQLNKINLKLLDDEYGLENFVPKSLYKSMKRKELIRLLLHSIKLNQHLFITISTDNITNNITNDNQQQQKPSKNLKIMKKLNNSNQSLNKLSLSTSSSLTSITSTCSSSISSLNRLNSFNNHYHYKNYQPFITSLQVKLQFLKILSELPCYGSKMFFTTKRLYNHNKNNSVNDNHLGRKEIEEFLLFIRAYHS
uniref:Uncharacterized serine-rich protein C215.13-like n=1 Tax=Dermatophagoides pteronyssinus TaxID=6956 RepID=A0A6P6XQH8_DERPT